MLFFAYNSSLLSLIYAIQVQGLLRNGAIAVQTKTVTACPASGGELINTTVRVSVSLYFEILVEVILIECFYYLGDT